VILVIPDKAGLRPGHQTGPLPPGGHPSNPGAESLLLILIISACFAGAFNAARELVKERAIYSRERAAGLAPASYLGPNWPCSDSSARYQPWYAHNQAYQRRRRPRPRRLSAAAGLR
jgi:hypothetical protein